MFNFYYFFVYVSGIPEDGCVGAEQRTMPWFLEHYLNTAYAPENRGPFKLASLGQSNVMTCYRFCCHEVVYVLFDAFCAAKNSEDKNILWRRESEFTQQKDVLWESFFTHKHNRNFQGGYINFSLSAQCQCYLRAMHHSDVPRKIL